MFISDSLIFLELQKTGGSHIRKLLKQYTDGEVSGKHNRIDEGYEDKLIIGSIRNPWDWYVSLWAYGVGGKGGVRIRTSKGLDFKYYNSLLPKAMGKNWLSPGQLITSMTCDLIKPKDKWEQVYRDANDPAAFREWLKLLLDTKRRFDFGEGYGFSPLSQHAGLLTYRYFRLCTTGETLFKNEQLSQQSYLTEYDANFNITKGVIRNESLEEDLVCYLKQAGYTLTADQQAAILDKGASKTNVSQRKPADFYYDDETAEMVGSRDKYLIDKYKYVSPI